MGISTSKTFSYGRYVGGYGNYYLYARIDLEETVDEYNGTSTINWSMYAYADMQVGNGNGGWLTGTVTVAGQNFTIEGQINIGSSWTYIRSGEVKGIAHHEETGEASISVGVSNFSTTAWLTDFNVYVNGSDSVALTKIAMGGNVYVCIGGQWKKGTVYVLNDGQWKKGKVHALNGGTWKKSRL